MITPDGAASLLIIDDDTDAHFLLGRMLVRAGIHHPLEIARGGTDGIKIFEACVRGERPWPLLVFLDIKMPQVNGFDVLKWLSERNLLGSTVIAMMSSSDAPQDVSQAFQLGAHTYLNKSVSADVLGSIVQGAIKVARVQQASRNAS